MIYLDSAAVVKLVRAENGTREIVEWLGDRAIHLATAQLLAGSPDADFEAFVSYDKRLLAAAASIGLPTASPGA